MKLKNKKTGEIVELLGISRKGDRTFVQFEDEKGVFKGEYSSLAELNAEWEDYEEPKGSALDLMILTLTNFIENEPDEDKVDLEECKQMLEKIKAWKRLKDKEFEFVGCCKDNTINFEFVGHPLSYDEAEEAEQDLAFLFGGEE